MMVVLGLVGVAAMGVLQVTSNTMKASKTSEIGMELNATVNSITQNLLNADACKNTFQGIGAIRDNLTISEIKNRTGQTLFDKVKKLGNNRLKINEFTINGVTIKPPAPGVTNSYGEFKLQIKLEKLGKGYHGTQFVTKNLPLQGEFDPSKNLVKCYSSTEDAVYTAKKQSCEDIGGTWDIPSDRCNLSSSRGRTVAASTEDLLAQIDDLKNNYLKDNYVNRAGDTMTGDLTISGKNLSAKIVEATDTVKAATQVCIGTNCRNFEKKECNKGDVTLGINPDGSPVCVSMLCADGYYFEKLDSSTGNPVCKPIPNGTCPANTYVSEVKTDGTVTCSPLPTVANKTCPTGKYVTSIAADGSITCENPNLNSNCKSPQYVSGFDSNGKMKCGFPACSTYTTNSDCTDAGCTWTPSPSCSTYSDSTSCINSGCKWNSSYCSTKINAAECVQLGSGCTMVNWYTYKTKPTCLAAGSTYKWDANPISGANCFECENQNPAYCNGTPKSSGTCSGKI